MRRSSVALGLLAAAMVDQQIHAQALASAAEFPSIRAAMTDVPAPSTQSTPRLIVIGFMGGRVSAGNLVHKEALVAQALQKRYPATVQAAVFANRDAASALKLVLKLLDEDGDGRLSEGEKSAARIVIYGHSWGASETVALAKRLNEQNIPVLLTIQVDSVQKPAENDSVIPPNVHEAVNFYQSEGLLHGRSVISAMDPSKTTILGNFESSYKATPVALDGYPWFARTFMRPHIEIENDTAVWNRIEAMIEAMIGAKIGGKTSAKLQ